MLRSTIRPLILLTLASCALEEAAPDLREGRIMSPFGPLDITYEVTPDGVMLYEGDIVISEDELIDPNVAYSGTVTHDKTWPYGVVPYVIDGGLPNQQRVVDAIIHWREVTGLHFVPRTTEDAYIAFIRHGDRCFSSVGKQGGRQEINLADDCGTGNTKHEIGHALGLIHEHTRADRDTYVDVHWTNIPVDKWHNYYKRLSGYDVGAYDFNSIMHYASEGTPEDPHMTKKDGSTFDKQRVGLSDGDRLGVEFLYGAMTNAGRYSAIDRTGRLTVYPRTPDLSVMRTAESTPGNSWSSSWSTLFPTTLFQSQPVVGRNADGRHQLFGTRIDARLVTSYQTASGPWTTWTPLDTSRQYLDAPAVGRGKDGHLFVFAVGADHQLYQMIQITPANSQSFTSGLPLGGWLQTTPGVGRTKDGQLIVVGRSASNLLTYRMQDAVGSWGPWTQLSTTAFAGVPAVGTNLDGTIVVAARNAATNAMTVFKRSASGTWSSQVLPGLATKGSPAFGRNLDGRLELAVIGADSSTYHAWQHTPNGLWSGWAGYGGYTISQTPELARLRDGKLQVMVRGGDDMLYRSVQTQANGAWGGWQVMPGHTAYTD